MARTATPTRTKDNVVIGQKGIMAKAHTEHQSRKKGRKGGGGLGWKNPLTMLYAALVSAIVVSLSIVEVGR